MRTVLFALARGWHAQVGPTEATVIPGANVAYESRHTASRVDRDGVCHARLLVGADPVIGFRSTIYAIIVGIARAGGSMQV